MLAAVRGMALHAVAEGAAPGHLVQVLYEVADDRDLPDVARPEDGGTGWRMRARHRLHEPDTATVVRVSNGEVLTTDGPFAEAREHLGGFYVINADDLDAALTWASKVTRCIGVPIEVRPFADFADEPRA